MDPLDMFEQVLRGAGFATQPLPQPGPCKTHKELGDWFVSFARECRLNLPKEKRDGV